MNNGIFMEGHGDKEKQPLFINNMADTRVDVNRNIEEVGLVY